MKKDFILSIFFTLIIIISALTSSGQDTMVLHDRSELYVKVVEVANDKISYRKTDNLNGPLYFIPLQDVFMAIYRGGKRETFGAAVRPGPEHAMAGNSQPSSATVVLSDETFGLLLKKMEHSNKGRFETATGEVDVFIGNNFFVTVAFNASQRKDAAPDFSHPRPVHVSKSGISMQIISPQMKDYLFEKYETGFGSGVGWVLSPGLIAGEDAAGCQVAFLKKPRQTDTDVWWLQGKPDFEKYELKSCASLEQKMLSVVLLWLKKNFSTPG